MKRNLTFFFTSGLVALMCFLLQTCKKDNICCKEEVCENFPKKEGIGVSIITQKPFQRHAPCFNPNNSDEFIYVKEDNNKYQLIKYNINSKIEIILLDNTVIVGQPKWGSNGWIVFTSNDYQVNLLKDDGLNFKKITSVGYFLYPDWYNDSILSVEFSYNLGVPYFHCRINNIGQILDTIRNSSFTLGTVNKLNEEAYLEYRDNPNIIFKNANNNLFNLTSFNFNGRNRIEGIYWHLNNNDVFFSTYREGLYKINKNTRNNSKIKCGCDSRSYRYLSISPDGKKIIVERVDATNFQNKTGSWTEEGKIFIMDIDGKNERNVFE